MSSKVLSSLAALVGVGPMKPMGLTPQDLGGDQRTERPVSRPFLRARAHLLGDAAPVRFQ